MKDKLQMHHPKYQQGGSKVTKAYINNLRRILSLPGGKLLNSSIQVKKERTKHSSKVHCVVLYASWYIMRQVDPYTDQNEQWNYASKVQDTCYGRPITPWHNRHIPSSG